MLPHQIIKNHRPDESDPINPDPIIHIIITRPVPHLNNSMSLLSAFFLKKKSYFNQQLNSMLKNLLQLRVPQDFAWLIMQICCFAKYTATMHKWGSKLKAISVSYNKFKQDSFCAASPVWFFYSPVFFCLCLPLLIFICIYTFTAKYSIHE